MTPRPPGSGSTARCGLGRGKVNDRQAATFGFTPPFNTTGQPSISLPLGMSAEGLPIGMMFTARYGDEAALFRLAAQLEDAMPWRQRRPPLFGTAGLGT